MHKYKSYLQIRHPGCCIFPNPSSSWALYSRSCKFFFLLNYRDVSQEFLGVMPYVKLQPAHGQMTWQMLVRGFLARSFEAAIFVKPATLCWKAGLHGIRCTLDASTSDSVFQQQKKGCPRRSLTNKPVPVWQPCTVSKNTSYRKGKKKQFNDSIFS